MTEIHVTQLPVPCIKLGEGPHWQHTSGALLYVDVFLKALKKYYVDTGRHQVLYIDDEDSETVTFVIPSAADPDLLVIGVGNKVAVVQWSRSDPDSRRTSPATLHTTQDDHFNDAKCDPQGRLWAGTMTPLDKKGEILEFNTSSLFRIDKDLTCTKWVDKTTISNGLAWSHDKKSLYFIDSPSKDIYHFDYDDVTGSISNKRVLLNYDSAGLQNQVPDGMTIDVDGNLWVACFGGGQVICIDPKDAKVLRKVSVPSPHVTSVCWGGDDYGTLYVTSGTLKLTPEQLSANPSAGGTFAITGLGTKGSPPNNCAIDLNILKDMMKK